MRSFPPPALDSTDPVGEFLSEVVIGDFHTGETTWTGAIAQIGIGLVPYVGQAADARDTIAAVKGVKEDPTSGWSWLGLTLAGVGWVPGIGDAVKAGGKALKKGFVKKAVKKAKKKAAVIDPHLHHVYPTDFAKDFEKVGIDWDRWRREIPGDVHLDQLHGSGNPKIPGVGKGGVYNKSWRQFLQGKEMRRLLDSDDPAKLALAKDRILRFGQFMTSPRGFRLTDFEAVQYRSKK